MDYLRQLWNGIVEAWRQLSMSARVNIALAGVAVLIVIGIIVAAGAREQYVTLSSDLDPAKLTEATQLLNTDGVNYEVSADNTSILVPASERSRLMLLLAQNNLPVGPSRRPGLESIQQAEMMSSRWLQDVKFMQAIQGEIERHLNMLDFVEHSLVLVRESPDEYFREDQKPSEAAVTLSVHRMPTPQEVRGMVNIIAASGGSNLHTNNITIMTTDGVNLHSPPSSDYMAVANSRHESTVQEERLAEQRIKEALAAIGKRSVVRVSALMDFDEKMVEEQIYADGAEVANEKTVTTLETSEQLPEGPPGAFANPPEGTASAGGVKTKEDSTTTIVNSEPSITRSTTSTPPGGVLKYTVALVIEGDTEEVTAEDGTVATTYQGLSDEDKEIYKNLALGTVGRAAQEAVVTVDDHPFEIDDLMIARAEMAQRQAAASLTQWISYMQTGALIFVILLGFFFIRVFLRRAIERPVEEVEEEEVREIPEATREDLRRSEVSAEVNAMAMDDPETVAVLLRSWLSEEED